MYKGLLARLPGSAAAWLLFVSLIIGLGFGLWHWRSAAQHSLGTQARLSRPSGLASIKTTGKNPGLSGGKTAVLLAVGDIARCGSPMASQTAQVVAANPGTLAVLGDNAYLSGSPAEFQQCYAPAYGPFKDRTKPAVGNHEYLTPGAAGFFSYFGNAGKGVNGRAYYSYDLGSWHIIVLNSQCQPAGGCGQGSPQEVWLRQDLASHPAVCSLAYFHKPYFNSGIFGDDRSLKPLVQDLYNAGVEIMLSGHAHDYERFAPQDPSGSLDLQHGIVQFVVGTGGAPHTALVYPLQPHSLDASDRVYGVLKLTLEPDGYTYQYLPAAGSSFSDRGSGVCH